MLQRAGIKTMLNELSSTVVFERPTEESFVRKWQLACEGDIAHVVVRCAQPQLMQGRWICLSQLGRLQAGPHHAGCGW